MQELTKVHTPEMHTIEQVCEFLHVDAKKSMKAVVYNVFGSFHIGTVITLITDYDRILSDWS